MSVKHPKWDNFIDTLVDEHHCDFKEDPFSWKCYHDYRFSTDILKAINFTEDDIRASIAAFQERGGYCDCEIVFNVGF